MIVSKLGKRELQDFRKLDRVMREGPEEELDLCPKPKVYRKTWIANTMTDCYEYADENYENQTIAHSNVRKTVWNRDVVAAKCIMIKGE